MTSAVARKNRRRGSPPWLAFGWDYVAMARRLAILEDRVETLLAAQVVDSSAPVRFPVVPSIEAESAPRSRVG